MRDPALKTVDFSIAELKLIGRLVRKHQQDVWSKMSDDTSLTAPDLTALTTEDRKCDFILAKIDEADVNWEER